MIPRAIRALPAGSILVTPESRRSQRGVGELQGPGAGAPGGCGDEGWDRASPLSQHIPDAWMHLGSRGPLLRNQARQEKSSCSLSCGRRSFANDLLWSIPTAGITHITCYRPSGETCSVACFRRSALWRCSWGSFAVFGKVKGSCQFAFWEAEC